MFALTSGTTATRKYIPVTDQYLADYKRGWNIWGLQGVPRPPGGAAAADRADVRRLGRVPHRGRHPVRRRHRPDGHDAEAHHPLAVLRAGRASAGSRTPRPSITSALRLSLPRQVGMIIAANPSTLHQPGPHRRPGEGSRCSATWPTARSIRASTFPPTCAQPCGRGCDNATRARPRAGGDHPPHRDAAIRSDYWPPNCLLGNWTGGSVGAYLRHYPRYFGDLPVRDVGLIASEGRMTIPLSDGTPAGVLDVTSHYFEFIPEDEVRQSAADRAGGRRAASRAATTTSCRRRRSACTATHPRRGARDRLPQPDAADRVSEQGRPLRQRDRREAVGISRHAVDGAGAARAGPDADRRTAWRRAGTTNCRITACSWSAATWPTRRRAGG